MTNNILITGLAGYIGSHCAKYLLEKGYDIIGIDNLSLGHSQAIEELKKIAQKHQRQFKFYETDIAESELVFSENKIDAVIHFAAFSLVGESMSNPLKYYLGNVAKSSLLFEQMLKYGVDKIVFSSTAATYGAPKDFPVSEESEQKPINPYGKSKLMIENILDDLGASSGLNSIRLRYFNVAGADFDGVLGEEHSPETHLIPNILKVALKIKNGSKDITPFKLFGTDYQTKDGTCVRDYIHVCDLAHAHYLALEKLFSNPQTGYFNLGSAQGYSVKEVFESAKKITGIDIALSYEPARAGDPPVLVASNQKASKELNWTPKYNLDQMIESAWNWTQNPKF